jgi:Domain of unknown function (DU1801)
MTSKIELPQDYIDSLPDDRKQAVTKLREILLANLPHGFAEVINYGSLGYVVPHSIYPKGYHCNPKLPLPFINVVSQKNFIALHHVGLYANITLTEWFTSEYPKHCKTKLDMGKGCIRFKKLDDIPYQLIAELATKITVQEWIICCEGFASKNKA